MLNCVVETRQKIVFEDVPLNSAKNVKKKFVNIAIDVGISQVIEDIDGMEKPKSILFEIFICSIVKNLNFKNQLKVISGYIGVKS